MNKLDPEKTCDTCLHTVKDSGKCGRYGREFLISFDHENNRCQYWDENKMRIVPEPLANIRPCPFCGAPAELRQGHLIMCMNDDCAVDPLHSAPNDVEVIAEWNSRPLEMAYLVEALALGEALYRVLHFLESGAGDKDAIAEDIRKTLDIGNAGR